jgi:hypothetical protein
MTLSGDSGLRKERVLTEASHPRIPSRAWAASALAGALWGLVSIFAIAFPQTYFGLLGYPLARSLRWLLPSWYAVLALAPADSFTYAMPAWVHAGLIGTASVALGVAAALALRWASMRLRIRTAGPRD